MLSPINYLNNIGDTPIDFIFIRLWKCALHLCS